jgi:hypothetical protein
MKKHELLRALEPFDDETDIWIYCRGRISERATEVKYVPSTGEGYAFVRIVAGCTPAYEEGFDRDRDNPL